jgi:hypothetical protein
MIVISAGMQKSGSGLYFNLTNDLMIAAGKHLLIFRKIICILTLAGPNDSGLSYPKKSGIFVLSSFQLI